jgi:hypothetical protein
MTTPLRPLGGQHQPPHQPVNLQALKKIMGSSLIWVAAAFLLLMIFLVATVRIGHVTGEQVGVLLNRITGRMDVVNESGVIIYNGIFKDFYVLDKTLQTLDMVERGKGGSRSQQGENLKIKTIDGSDVYVSLKVQYRLIPSMAETILTSSGPGNAYKQKWPRPYTRAICRNYLGELTTEQFYDAAKRDAKIALAQQQANEQLNAYGINIDSIVIPRKPRFYEEYENMIKEKKLADQAVLEEKSKALAAKQRQQTLIVEETNKKNVALEQFRGQMQQKIIAANANAQKEKKASDAYYEKETIGAEAALYRMQKTSEAVLARKEAEAQGVKALCEALSGEGGRNMVKLEYVNKLRDAQITGKPFTVDGRVERFEHLKAPATTTVK